MTEVSASAGPHLPGSFRSIWEQGDHGLHGVYHQLRALSLTVFREGLEPISPPPVEGAAPYVELRTPHGACPDDVDPESAIIVPHPFGIGWGKGAEYHALRTRMIHSPNSTQRLITFPNSGPGRPTFDFTPPERQKVAAGDFTPVSDRVFRTLEALGISNIKAACYSQAAATGGHIMARAATGGNFDVGDSGFIDMPNITQRPTARLICDFLATGAGDVAKARKHADMYVLAETPCSAARAVRDLSGKIAQPDNWAFARGLRHNTFGADMRRFLGSSAARILLVRAEHSTVTPKKPFDTMATNLRQEFPGRVTAEEIPGYGHGVGENSALHALLMQLALNPTRGTSA